MVFLALCKRSYQIVFDKCLVTNHTQFICNTRIEHRHALVCYPYTFTLQTYTERRIRQDKASRQVYYTDDSRMRTPDLPVKPTQTTKYYVF